MCHAAWADIFPPSLSSWWLPSRGPILQVFLTPTHLGIVMEYAAGGELFDRIVKAGRFSEDEARFFFQQLISGVSYCHSEVRLLDSAAAVPLTTGASHSL